MPRKKTENQEVTEEVKPKIETQPKVIEKARTELDRDELPVYQYRLSSYGVTLFSQDQVKNGVMVQGITLKDSWTTFPAKMNHFDRLLVSEKNPKGLVEFQSLIPKTQEVTNKNY